MLRINLILKAKFGDSPLVLRVSLTTEGFNTDIMIKYFYLIKSNRFV